MKTLLVLTSIVALFLAAQLDGKPSSYETYIGGNAPKAAEALTVSAGFHRGYTVEQSQPCWNEHTKAHYESDLISKDETAHNLLAVGASVEQADILAAISRAESGSQLNCFGDDSKKYYGQPTSDGRHWGESYGLFQIRTIIEADGTGECRDMSRLKNNIEQQSICAWELSASGTKFSPTWSQYTNGNYREYLGANW